MKTDTIRDVLSEVNDFYGEGHNLEFSEVVEMMKIQRLDRIANVLEDINSALINMGGDIEALGDCVGTIPARYTQGLDVHFLRIGGSVDTGI